MPPMSMGEKGPSLARIGALFSGAGMFISAIEPMPSAPMVM